MGLICKLNYLNVTQISHVLYKTVLASGKWVNFLSDKYHWCEISLLSQAVWKHMVSKDQFCSCILPRMKHAGVTDFQPWIVQLENPRLKQWLHLHIAISHNLSNIIMSLHIRYGQLQLHIALWSSLYGTLGWKGSGHLGPYNKCQFN